MQDQISPIGLTLRVFNGLGLGTADNYAKETYSIADQFNKSLITTSNLINYFLKNNPSSPEKAKMEAYKAELQKNITYLSGNLEKHKNAVAGKVSSGSAKAITNDLSILGEEEYRKVEELAKQPGIAPSGN